MSRNLVPVVPFKGSSGFLRGNSAGVLKVLRKGILCYNLNNRLIEETNLFLEKYWYSRSLSFAKNGREITPSLLQPRKVDIAEEVATKESKKRGPAPFEWAPFPRIPNVAKFKILDNGYDELMKMFNLDKKLPRSFETEPYNNGPKVKYAKRQILYLRKLIVSGRYAVFWKTSMFLLEHSTVFQLMAVYKCYPGFHRDLALGTVYAILDEVRRVVREKTWELKYKRVYIPKGLSDKWRPLGVPTPVWRVILAGLTFFVVTAYDHLLPPWQHAYRPGKGTLSAWEVVLKDVRNSKYIWEFDIKGFFDNVPVLKVLSTLEKEMPTEIRSIFSHMASLAPKLPSEKKIDELSALAKGIYSGQTEAPAPGSDHPVFDWMHTKLAEHGMKFSELRAPVRPVEGSVITKPFEIIDLTLDDDDSEEEPQPNKALESGKESVAPSNLESEAQASARYPGYSKIHVPAEGEINPDTMFGSIYHWMERRVKYLESQGAAPASGVFVTPFREPSAEESELQQAEKVESKVSVVAKKPKRKKLGYKVLHGEEDNIWNKGFPQGVAYSAFLSVLYLRGLQLKPSILMYADDGLLYSNERFDEGQFRTELAKLGLELSEHKCKWVKREGVWLSRLKFLGLVLENGEELKSETRSDWRRGGTVFREGVSHKFDQHQLVRAKTLERMGVPTQLAFKLATVSGKIEQFYGEVRYLPVRLLRSGKLLVQGWDWTQKKFSLDLYRRYIPKHWLGTKEEIQKYFWLLLTGRQMTESNEGNQDIRPVYEESLLALAKQGESKEVLQGRLDYLIKLKPLSLSEKVESAVIRGVTWEEVLDSRLMGWFQSKMYWSGFTNEKVDQDFQLTFKAGTSWLAKRTEGVFKYERYYKGLKLNFANSTSVAWHDLLEMYSVHAKCRIWLQSYKKGWLSLDEMNNRRGAVGRPPIKGTYVRHLKPVIPMEEFASGRLLTWGEIRLSVDSKVRKSRGRPLGQSNPPGHLAGRPAGGKNKPGHRAGRPRKVN